MSIPHTYWIDIVGACNLRCPSCPTGNLFPYVKGEDKPYGMMAADLYYEILQKISDEAQGELVRIELYNWGEPLLHPKLPEFIKKTREYDNFRCGISSNLSLKMDLRPVIEANPHWFRVSLSGYYQSVYSKTHVRGDIRLVKSNLYYLRYLIDKLGVELPIDVVYHLYKGNVGNDISSMMDLCNELQFKFNPIWASFYPLEKIIENLVDGKNPAAQDAVIMGELVIESKVALDIAQKWKSDACRLQDHQTAINFDGSVQLCCATYSSQNVIASSFLDKSSTELSDIKSKHSTCDKCISNGLHSMMMYKGIDMLDEIGNQVIGGLGSPWIFDTRNAKIKSR